MANSATDLSDQDFFYSFMAEYLDGDLPPALASRYDALLKAGQAYTPEQFQTMRGKLQLSLQSFFLKENELTELHGFVVDPSHAAAEENSKIEQLGRGFAVNTLVRRLVLAGVAILLVALAIWRMGPQKSDTFKPLDYLGYEALAMEEDAQARLNLPSRDPREIRQYLSSYPGLDFKPKMLKGVPAPWQADGATVIDYEIAKVAAVMYENPQNKEKLFHFSWAGELSDLPKAEPGNMRGLIFQTYSSAELNLVAWQSSPGVLSLLVGRRSAPELAEIAVAGSGKN